MQVQDNDSAGSASGAPPRVAAGLLAAMLSIAGCDAYDPAALMFRDAAVDSGMDARAPDAGMDAGRDAAADGGATELCNGEDDDGDGAVDEGEAPRQHCLEQFAHVAAAICDDGRCLKRDNDACAPGWCDCTGRGLINDCNTPFVEGGPNCHCTPPPAMDAGSDASTDASLDAGADASFDASSL